MKTHAKSAANVMMKFELNQSSSWPLTSTISRQGGRQRKRFRWFHNAALATTGRPRRPRAQKQNNGFQQSYWMLLDSRPGAWPCCFIGILVVARAIVTWGGMGIVARRPPVARCWIRRGIIAGFARGFRPLACGAAFDIGYAVGYQFDRGYGSLRSGGENLFQA